MEISLSRNSSFQELLKSNKDLERFGELLSQFLREDFFPYLDHVPNRVDFKIFQDPETAVERPMIEIYLSSSEIITRAEIQHDFVSRFKAFLAKVANDADEFVMLRREQRIVMIIFTFE